MRETTLRRLLTYNPQHRMTSFSLFHGRFEDLIEAAAETTLSKIPSGSATAPTPAVTFVVPSQGTANALAEALLGRFGSSFTGIEIATLEETARSILNHRGHFPRMATELETRIAMDTALRGIDLEDLRTPGLTSILLRSWRDLRDSNLSLELLSTMVNKGALDNPERLGLIYSVWTRYQATIDGLSAIDTAELLRRATRFVERDSIHGRVSILGFYDATEAQFRLLESLISHTSLDGVWLPIEVDDDGPTAPFEFARPLLERLRRLGGDPTPITGRPTARSISFSCHTTRRDELRETARRVATLLSEGVDPRTIGVVVRSVEPTEHVILDRVTREFGFTIDPSPGFPPRAHRIVRGLRLLFSIREDNFPRGAVFDLIECGLAERGLAPSIERVGRLDRATRRAGIAGGSGANLRHSIETAIREQPRLESELRQYADIVDRLARMAPRHDRLESPGYWADRIQNYLGLLRIDDELDLAITERIDEVTSTLRRFDQAEVALEARQILDVLDHAADALPIQTRTGGVWFGDLMRLRGRTFDHLFAVGLEESRFPQGRNADPILTERDRTRLGMRLIGDGLAEERLLFELTVLAARQSFHLSFSRTDGVRTSRPSRFAKHLAASVRPGDVREIAADFASLLSTDPVFVGARAPLERRLDRIRSGELTPEEISSRFRRQLRLLASTRTRSSYDGWIEPTEEIRAAIQARLESMAPTRLEDYGECPQRFLMRRLLLVEDLDDPEQGIEIEIRKKGILSHKILERFYSSLEPEVLASLDSSGIPDEIRRVLHNAVEEESDEFDRAFPPFIEPIRSIERGALAKLLDDFVALDIAEMRQAGLQPYEFERSFGETESDRVTWEINGVTMSLRGRIDRIDHNAEDRRFRVVDYKYGSGSRHDGIGQKIDKGLVLQLPLYGLAATKIYDSASSLISGMIKPLRHPPRADRFAFELGEKEVILRSILSIFVERILSGAFPAIVGRNEQNCRYCALRHSCRTRSDPKERSYTEAFAGAIDLFAREENQ